MDTRRDSFATILDNRGLEYARSEAKRRARVKVLAMPDVIRLEYRNVTMRFAQGGQPHRRAGVSIAVRDGEVVSLIGPSGCGKSTLLNIGSG
jgi:ABC-type glutathione transport system ATPase component